MFYLKRTFQYLLVLFCILVLNFLLPRLAPGNPAQYLAGIDILFMDQDQIASIMREFKLDLPIVEQFKNYIFGIFKGELGLSVKYARPVIDVLWAKLPWTLLLMGTALLLSTILGIALGILGAWRRGGAKDIGSLVTIMVLSSVPPFWLAMLLITLFSAHLGWLPSFGAYSIVTPPGTPEYYWQVLRRLILPVMTLTLIKTGSIYLTTRSAMILSLEEDFVLLAKAKGLKDRVVVFKHAFRNAILPVYTHVMTQMGAMLGGTAVVETVFSYPGLGQTIFESVGARDYNLLQGAFLFASVSILICNLIADLSYPLLDPRIRRMRSL